RLRVVRARRRGDAGARQRSAVDAVDDRLAPYRRKGETHCGFREPINGKLGPGVEAVSGEALVEAGDGIRAHRLRAVEGDAPRREIEARERARVDARRAHFVGEVRARGQGAAIA